MYIDRGKNKNIYFVVVITAIYIPKGFSSLELCTWFNPRNCGLNCAS